MTREPARDSPKGTDGSVRTFAVIELEYPAGYDGLALSENPVATSADAPDAYVSCFLPLDQEVPEA